MAQPYQRKSDKRWVADYTDNTGHRRYVYAKTRREVLKKRDEAIALREAGRLPTSGSTRLDAFLTTWLEDTIRPSTTYKTHATYTSILKRVIDTYGAIHLKDLRPAHIQNLYAELLQNEHLSPATVRLIHTALRQALNQAVQWNLIPRNPTDSLRLPKLEKQKNIDPLTYDEALELLTQTRADPEYPLWLLLIETGLRIGEATGLLWADIDIPNRKIHVRRTLQYRVGQGYVLTDQTKTKTSRRTISITPELAQTLEAHQRRQLTQPPSPDTDGEATRDPLVFRTKAGNPFGQNRAKSALRRATRRAGLPDITPHDLRHTCATLLLGRNTHPKKVQQLLGHASIAQTLDTYSHIIPGMDDDITDAMTSMFAGVLSDSLSTAPPNTQTA